MFSQSYNNIQQGYVGVEDIFVFFVIWFIHVSLYTILFLRTKYLKINHCDLLKSNYCLWIFGFNSLQLLLLFSVSQGYNIWLSATLLHSTQYDVFTHCIHAGWIAIGSLIIFLIAECLHKCNNGAKWTTG